MKIRFIIVCMILPILGMANENASVTLSINDAVTTAIKNNIELKNTKLELVNNKISLATAWNSFLPNASASVSLGKKQSVSASDSSSSGSLSAGFSTSLSVNASMVTDIIQAGLDYQNGKLTYDQAKNTLEYNTKQYYYNLVLLKEELTLQQRQLDTAKKRYDLALVKYQNGSESEIDKLTTELAYKTALYDYKKLDNEYMQAELNFKYVLGLDQTSVISLSDPLPEIADATELLQNADVNKSSDVALVYNELKSAENDRLALIASLTPTFSLGYSVASSFDKDPFESSLADNVSSNWDTSSSLSLSVSVPLSWALPFSADQVNIIKNENSIQIKKNELEDKRNSIEIKIAGIAMTLKEIKTDIESLETNKEIATRTYELTQRLYEAGNKDYLELKDAENDMYSTEVDLLNARYEYLTNILELTYMFTNIDSGVKGE